MGRLMSMMYDRMMGATEAACLGEWRRDLLASASGTVLEVGAGTGVNLPLYGASVERLVATEPDPHMRSRLLARAQNCAPPELEVTAADACSLPHEDDTFDCAVATLVLCSVADLERAVAELGRVLRPGGLFLFLEHVAADSRPGRLRWQHRLEPLWKLCSGNCHLTRRTEQAIVAGGFSLRAIHRESMRKAMPLVRPTIRGVAVSG